MLVDTLLKWYGLNPIAYQSMEDKWIAVSIYLLNTAYPIITTVLTLLPWVFFLIYRKQHKKDIKKFTFLILKLSIAGLLFGLILPDLVIWITGAAAIHALYDGQGFF